MIYINSTLFKENRLIMFGKGAEAPKHLEGDPLAGIMDEPEKLTPDEKAERAKNKRIREVNERTEKMMEEVRAKEAKEAGNKVCDIIQTMDKQEQTLQRLKDRAKTAKDLHKLKVASQHIVIMAGKLGIAKYSLSADVATLLNSVKTDLLAQEFGIDNPSDPNTFRNIINEMDSITQDTKYRSGGREKAWDIYNKFAAVTNSADRAIRELK